MEDGADSNRIERERVRGYGRAAVEQCASVGSDVQDTLRERGNLACEATGSATRTMGPVTIGDDIV